MIILVWILVIGLIFLDLAFKVLFGERISLWVQLWRFEAEIGEEFGKISERLGSENPDYQDLRERYRNISYETLSEMREAIKEYEVLFYHIKDAEKSKTRLVSASKHT